jgi:hypothetical protein
MSMPSGASFVKFTERKDAKCLSPQIIPKIIATERIAVQRSIALLKVYV